MKIELTNEQYAELLELLPYISDESYAYRVAELIKSVINSKSS